MHEKSPMKGGESVFPFNTFIGSNPNRLDLVCDVENSNLKYRISNATEATNLDKIILGSKDYRFLTENTIIFKTCSGNIYVANINSFNRC